MSSTLFFDGALLSLSLCLDLGIVNLAIVRAGITRGAIPAFLIGLGSCFGDIFWAGLAGAGVASLLQYVVVRWSLWIGGTIALIYLTVQMLIHTFNPPPLNATGGHGEAGVTSTQNRSWVRDVLEGLLLAIASPSAILWFAAVGGSVIASATSEATPIDLAWFYVGFFLTGMVWSLAIAVVATATGRTLGPSLVRVASLGAAVLFVYFAVRVFTAGYTTLLAPTTL